MLVEVSKGRWFFKVNSNNVYDENYIKKYEEYDSSNRGKKINEFRQEVIKGFGEKNYLDVGVGSGKLVKDLHCFGYDVNEVMKKRLKGNGQFKDLYKDDLTDIHTFCFFDSFEHIEDLGEVIHKLKKGDVFITSIPLLKNGAIKEDVLKWKHYREDEHYHYFTIDAFLSFMLIDFDVLFCSDYEIKLGREDIYTYVFKKR